MAGFSNDDIVLLAGSTQEPEEAMVLETFRELSPQFPHLRLVLVPRHPDRFESVAKLLDSSGIAWQRRTALDEGSGFRVQGSGTENQQPSDGVAVELPPQQRVQGSGNETHPSPLTPHPSPLTPLPSPLAPRILLVDIVGELGAWWGTARIAFVGGSMGNRGGQNMIEPAAYGAAISFGPNTWNFRDIVAAMLALDAAAVVSDGPQFTQFVGAAWPSPTMRPPWAAAPNGWCSAQLGATAKTLRLLSQLADTPADTSTVGRSL